MQTKSLPLRSDEMPPDTVAGHASTSLRVHALQLDMIASYGSLLEQEIFDRSGVGRVDKLQQSYRRTLKSIDAYKILSIIWKESEFIAGEDLRTAGLSSLFESRQLTAWSLACEMSETKHDVAAINTRIRNVALAASAYLLVDRDTVRSTAVILKGTQLLHDFMMKLSERNIQTLRDFTDLINCLSLHQNPNGDR